jgi:hypothetical protein
MCSTSVQRLAEIGRAIDDLAAQAEANSREAGRAGAAGTACAAGAVDVPASAFSERGRADDNTDQVMRRLADLWAKLAQLDPEVAKRLPTYEA